MANFGHLVAKFQVTEEGDPGSATKKAKENQPPVDGPPMSAGDDGGTVKPPSGEITKRQRPAPPGRKPSRIVPPGVNMRKQQSLDSSAPSAQGQRKGSGTNRQSSISFTTEDLDLFQKKKASARRKRIESTSSTKHGRPQITEPPPLEDKADLRRSRPGNRQGQDSSSEKRRSRSVGAPAFGGLRPMPPPNKPKVPSKPAVADKPSDIRKKPSSLPRPFQAQQSADTSDEPTAERRPPSGFRNKSYKVATRTPRPTSGSRSRSGSQSKKGADASKNVTSPANSLSPTSPSSDVRQVSRSRSGSGSRPSSGGSKQRPFSGSRSGRSPAGDVKQSSQVHSPHEQNKENDHAHVAGEHPPIKPLLGPGLEQNSDFELKKKPKTQVGGSFIPVPKSYPKVPPKISPKPKSPGQSPLGSPRTIRAFKNRSPGTTGSDEDIKAAAKANILSALAKRTVIPVNRDSAEPVEQPDIADQTAEQRLIKQESETQERVSVVVEGVTTGESSEGTGASFKDTKGTESETLERVSVVVEGVTVTETSDSTGASFKRTENTWSDQREESNVSLQENEGKSEVVQNGDQRELGELTKQAEIEGQNDSDQIVNGEASSNTEVKKASPKRHVAKGDHTPTVTSTENSPSLKKKKSFKKPSVPPPPPPSQQDISKLDIKSASVDATRSETDELQKKSPSIPPKPSSAKLVKCGLNNKGQDIPVCKLVADKNNSNSSQGSLDNQAVPSADQKLLPLQIFSGEQKGSPSDSNDADDEEDLKSGASPKSRVYIKSFSVEQKDLVSSIAGVNRGRPSSEITPESDSSSSEQKDQHKKGVLDKIKKLTFGLLPSAGEVGDRRQVGEATFYPEEDVPGTTKEGELHRTVGKTTFYSGENKTNGEANPSQDENVNSNENSPVEKQRKVSLRHGAAGRKLSNKSFRSGIFVENDLYEEGNGLGAYEHVFFGNISQNVAKQPARGKLDSSSLESVEDKQNERPKSQDMESLGSGDQAQPMKTQAETERGLVQDVTSTDDDRHSDHIYDNAIPRGNNNHIYTNVEFNSYTRSWRRKTIKRRRSPGKNDDENETEDGRQTEDFEDFSNSDDSFDSDTYTDDSEEGKDSIEPKYATIQGEAPPSEEPVSKVGKLQRIATELLGTERAYVKRLHLIDQVFHFKIVIENRSHHMFPDDVIPQMFSNIKSIYQFHNDFLLPQLEKRMADWENTPKIGDLMSKFAPFLKLYSEYVKNFDHAVNTLNTWQQRSPMFANVIIELQKKPECGMLSLQHHMLEPIQRVPRYELLLKDYLKNLPEDSDDKADTEKALVLVTTAASHANETMWKIEKFRKLLELNEMFGGVVDLIDPSRELLKEGKIFKISARNGVLYDRYLFLFTDMMLLCTNHRMGLTAARSYHINNVLKLSGMQIMEGDNLETPFTFYVKTQSKTIELHCSTQDEMQDWYGAIEDVITEFTKRQMSRLAGLKTTEADDKLGVCAPTWVKDQNTSMCMLCASAFSMLKRRHHCRCCGIVVCARCSSHKAPLAYQNNKPDRVCDNCYKTLSGRAENEGLGQNSNPRVKGVLQVKGSDPSVVSGMMQMSSDKKIWERRWFALHENFVLYTFKAPQDVHAITSMPLPGYTVSETCKDDHIDKERVIKLYHAGTKKTYFFHIDNNTNYTKWLTGLQCAVKVELPPDYVPIEKRSQ